MSVRSSINRNAGTVGIVVVALVGVCLWVTWSNAHPAAPPKAPTMGFFTADEGKSWHAQPLMRFTNFGQDGSTMVRAYVYQCGGGAPFVAYLQRHTTKWTDLVEKYKDAPPAKPGVRPAWADDFASLGAGALEVKRPGEDQWVNMADPTACDITSYACKGGAEAVAVAPDESPQPTASVK